MKLRVGLVPLPYHSMQITKLLGQLTETELKWALALISQSAFPLLLPNATEYVF